MPRYDLPPLQPRQPEVAMNTPTVDGGLSGPDEWERTLSIPVNQAILSAMEVDGEVVIELRGKVASLSSNQTNTRSNASMSVVISSVEAYPADDGYEEQEQFEQSFNKARGMFPGKHY